MACAPVGGFAYACSVSDGAPEGSDLELPAGDDDTLDDPQDLLDRVKRAQALHDGGDSGADSVSGTGEGAAGPEMHEAPDDDHTVIPDDATLSRLRISLAESRAQASSEPSGSEERTIGGGGRRSRR